MTALPSSPAALQQALGAHGYLADDGLATSAWLACSLDRPLLCEGPPGVGKTALAGALAEVLGGDHIRLQCYEGIDAGQALHEWDFPRQLLHLRAVEADGRGDAESDVYQRRFLLARPILQALERSTPDRRAVLLIDEIDRADDEFEALLLEVLSEWAVTVPEFGRIAAEIPPVVILTSNRTRDLHDALTRRCLYHWFSLPDADRERSILLRHVPEAAEALTESVLAAVARLRGLDLVKTPGIAESIDWLRALVRLGVDELDEATAQLTLGTVIKEHDDLAVVAESGPVAGGAPPTPPRKPDSLRSPASPRTPASPRNSATPGSRL
ncbi:MoxR family ATPase [Brevibacterium daeguense]|uniref:MoxR family ATPase n=1 Tax=Brevibacterium daeguense TaxID=909936 RepID=A0ABP8EH18_9MICO|nr:MoxR family ATPase [Brevibacterium daeguense]